MLLFLSVLPAQIMNFDNVTGVYISNFKAPFCQDLKPFCQLGHEGFFFSLQVFYGVCLVREKFAKKLL
jgi:hypothetical protein